jgi:hypothetical protein
MKIFRKAVLDIATLTAVAGLAGIRAATEYEDSFEHSGQVAHAAGLTQTTKAALSQHMVRIPGTQDEIYAPLYDSIVYPAAGSNQLTFFALPIGQGVTSAPGGAGAKTENDTNLSNAGLLPLGNRFYMSGIELLFFPGVNPGTGPTADATFIGQFWNDVYAFAKSGWLRFRVQNRDYVLDAPMINFPPVARLAGIAAATSTLTAGAATLDQIQYASIAGLPYNLVPMFIESNQSFTCTLNWIAPVALPSTIAARVFARLRGRLIRDAQ